MKTVGIIGGMGPMATIDLYKKITLNTKAERDQDHLHILIDSNTKIPDRTNFILNGGESPLPELERSAQRLAQAGCDFLIIPCNTSHYFYDTLTRSVSIPILNLPDTSVEHICERFGKGVRVGVLATDGTLRSGIYDQYLHKYGLEVVKPKRHQRSVMEYIYEGIKKNNLDYPTEGLKAAIAEMEEQGAEAFILGCTEFSVVSDLELFDERFIDPLSVLARKTVSEAGGILEKK